MNYVNEVQVSEHCRKVYKSGTRSIDYFFSFSLKSSKTNQVRIRSRPLVIPLPTAIIRSCSVLFLRDKNPRF